MLKITITTDKPIYMTDITSCTKVDLGERKIDYAFGPSVPSEYNYFEIGMNGSIKILAVNGKVELIESPLAENILNTWNPKG